MDNILNTKLIAPPLQTSLIKREHLLRKLEDSYDHGIPIFLVTGPPGYGKTILVSYWLKCSMKLYSWLSLDEKDDNPSTFFRYLIAALRKINANIGQASENLLAGPSVPPVDMIMNPLINDIIDSGREFILVLDDIHVLSSKYIIESLQYLIKHISESLKLILISRENPSFPLARLRSSRKIMEINQDELRFDKEESKAFLNYVMDINIPLNTLEQLELKLEGWPAGLQLAALSMKSKENSNSDAIIDKFTPGNRYIAEYLVDEVLKQIDAKTKDFLVKTSLLERFNASICDYITDLSDSSTIIEGLKRKNLFLTALDDEREWYRYHHFFADLLQSELKNEEKSVIYKKASIWFEQQGMMIEAMDKALLIGDTKRVEQLLVSVADDLFFHGESRTFLKYLNALSEEQIQKNAILGTYRVWTLFSTGYLSECFLLMENLKSSDVLNNDLLYYGSFLVLNVILLIQKRDMNALDMAQKALALVKNKNQAIEIFALIMVGNAQLLFEDSYAAINTFKNAFELSKKGKYQFNFISAFCRYTDVLILAGRRREALECCQKLLNESVDDWGRILPIAKTAYLPLGLAYYESGEYELAKAYIENAMLFYKPIGLINFLSEAEYRLAKILYLQGKKQEAYKRIEDILNTAQSANHMWVRQLMNMLKAEFALLDGRIEEAALLLNIDDVPLHEILDERLILLKVRILIAGRKIKEAKDLLDYVEESVNKTKHMQYLIYIHVQRSVICKSQGLFKDAEQYMLQALNAAKEDLYIQAFLEDYSLISDLLRKNKNMAPKLIQKIEEIAAVNLYVNREDNAKEKTKFYKDFLIEGLSNREKEIILLIDQGFTNKEIAQKLFITIGTTKWHINNIFSKFEVTTRSKAIVRARELRILPIES